MTDLAIDIGGTYIKFAAVNDTCQVEQFWKIPTRLKGVGLTYDYIVEHIPAYSTFRGIAVSTPGVLTPAGEVITKSSSTLSDLYQTNICREIHQRTGHPVTAINDGNAAALYEACFGAARHSQSSITIVIGTGIGGGICRNGELMEGAAFGAGEFHLIPYYHDNGERRKLGDLCKIGALKRFYSEITSKHLSAEEIFLQLDQGALAAVCAVDQWIYHLTTLLMILSASYNPDIFCVGGAVSENMQFMMKLSQNYHTDSQQYFRNSVHTKAEVVPCSHQNDSNLLGAVLHHRHCISKTSNGGISNPFFQIS